MSDLAPCPFCGGLPLAILIEEGENAGGSCVECTECGASSNVEFGRKENYISNWNRRVLGGKMVLAAAELVKSMAPSDEGEAERFKALVRAADNLRK